MMHGTCPKCGHHQKISAGPGTVAFGNLVVRTAAEIAGVKVSDLAKGRHGKQSVRHVRAAVARYLRFRGLTWEKVGRPMGRDPANVYAMQNNWHSETSEKIFKALIIACGSDDVEETHRILILDGVEIDGGLEVSFAEAYIRGRLPDGGRFVIEPGSYETTLEAMKSGRPFAEAS